MPIPAPPPPAPLPTPPPPAKIPGVGEFAGHVVCKAAHLKPAPLRWLWKDRLPLGKITLLCGAGDSGKSLLVTDLAARVSTGADWPDGSACPEPGQNQNRGSDVLIATHDGEADTLLPRLARHGADTERVHVLRGYAFRPGMDSAEMRMIHMGGLAALRGVISELKQHLRLVILDPASVYLGGAAAARVVLAELADIAQRYQVAIVLTAEMQNAGPPGGLPGIHGPRELMSSARTVWVLTRDIEQPHRRLLRIVKNNFAAAGQRHVFSIDQGKIVWETQARADAPTSPGAAPTDEAEERARRLRRANQRQQQREDQAAAFVRDFLDQGPRAWAAIKSAGVIAGHGPTLLQRVAGDVAESFKNDQFGGRWLWRLIGDPRTSSPEDEIDMVRLMEIRRLESGDMDDEISAEIDAALDEGDPEESPAAPDRLKVMSGRPQVTRRIGLVEVPIAPASAQGAGDKKTEVRLAGSKSGVRKLQNAVKSALGTVPIKLSFGKG